MGTPLVVHGHFYQPPRENPWTGDIDPQPGAAPFRDWNERVHAECYRPNAWARILDERGRVKAIVNNYANISFDIGPTLMAWLEAKHPATYRRIIDADQAGSNGGRALAQAYHHSILPLANARDRRTEILWGLADFAHRFGRSARGMWLPETAADDATLAALAETGVSYTVLAPSQAATPIDTGLPYRWAGDQRLTLLFYDGALARSVAFESAAVTSETLADRLDRARSATDGIVHLATDGETYGHHVKFAERTLAYALAHTAVERGFEVTYYDDFVARSTPLGEAAVVDQSSWSCQHGVDRWRRDCGCSTGGAPGEHQRWREPLRHALDVVRDRSARAFETIGADLFADPWVARDDYIDVVLGKVAALAFCDAHAARASRSRADLARAHRLLEMQRFALRMYTSCGWFFHDIAGVETVQVLRYAARAIELAEQAGVNGLRDEMVSRLDRAEGNDPKLRTGAFVWRAMVEPAATPPSRVAAHFALLLLAGDGSGHGQAGRFVLTASTTRKDTHGRVRLATGRLDLESVDDASTAQFAFCAAYLGGIDFHGVLRPYTSDADLAKASDPVWAEWPDSPLVRLLELIREHWSGETFGLDAALPQGRQEIVETVFADLVVRFGESFDRAYTDHARILDLLVSTGYQLPRELSITAEMALSRAIQRDIASVGAKLDRDRLGRAVELADIARQNAWNLDLGETGALLQEEVESAVSEATRFSSRAATERAHALLDIAEDFGIALNIERAQEILWPQRADFDELAERLGLSVP